MNEAQTNLAGELNSKPRERHSTQSDGLVSSVPMEMYQKVFEERDKLKVEKLRLQQDRDKFVELNGEKFITINAYCRMASMDKWKITKLIEAIDQYISSAGYNEHTKLLTEARADVVNSKINLIR